MDCNCILMFMRYAFTLICEYLKVLLKKSKHFKLLWINWSRTFSFNFKLWQIYWNTWNIFGGNYKRHNYFFLFIWLILLIFIILQKDASILTMLMSDMWAANVIGRSRIPWISLKHTNAVKRRVGCWPRFRTRRHRQK